MKYLPALRRAAATVACLLLSVLLATALAAPAGATSAAQIPDISRDATTWVADEAEALSRINEVRLGRRLQALADSTGTEVKVVVFRRLNYDVTIDDFADDLFERWYPTAALQANKVLLVMDTITNNAALRKGEGVTPLTDDLVQSLIADSIGVPIRAGNKYNEAFLGTTARLAAVLSGQADPGPPEDNIDIQVEGTFTAAEDTDTRTSTVWVVVLLVVATIVPMATYFAYVLLQD
ncbi:beta-propeller domains of methanol dehydrogenase type [Rubidibacter lacunae KORDI 51-2]|uniref:Beta-propeller domains of methanol dehydrogenase type n=1 Tax=Rubidibacter lacunae KORDI 51-2 TaxID=582515 RepID=U5DE47_9CHRO|nr:TPM domain-containing protein [Rubidibacter lacunae]ERN42778.1 beta-propeller domains of methanol dehydrogenase type [Rubidibacter lacunae KORDI 51-2]